jgi:hypothetical protein
MKTYETFRREIIEYMEENGKTITDKEIVEKYNEYRKNTGAEEKPVKEKKVKVKKEKTELPESFKLVSEAGKEYKDAVAAKKADPSDENKERVKTAFKNLISAREEKKKWKNDNS